MAHQIPHHMFSVGHTDFTGLGKVWFNLTEPDLMAEAIIRDEGTLGIHREYDLVGKQRSDDA